MTVIKLNQRHEEAAGQQRSAMLALVVILGLLALRLILINASPLQAVESQQAHLAWSWNQGRLPYRDIVDLYPPLLGWWQRFPLWWFGPQASILTWLRMSALPWYGLSLYALWSIGRRLYGSETALAGMILVGLYPALFTVMGQAAVDGMWCALTLGALAVLVTAPSGGSRRRAWLAGLLAGLALCLSLQMAWLLSLFAVAAITVILRRLGDRPASVLHLFGWGLAGLLLAPTGCLLWLAWHGAIPALLTWLADESLGEGGLVEGWRMLGCLSLAILGLVWLSLRRGFATADSPAAWRLFLVLCAWLGLTLVVLAWPWYGRPDFMPLVAISGLVMCGEVSRWLHARGFANRPAWLLWVCIELVCIGWAMPPGWDALRGQREMLAVVLRYSAPGDLVMDADGGAIFRQRPYYPFLRSSQAWAAGVRRLPDNVANELVRNSTHMVIREFLSPWSDSFVARNYLHLAGPVYVAGKAVTAASAAGVERSVGLELAGDYTLSNGLQAVTAGMDGQPPSSHWRLSVGPHYLQTPRREALLLIDSRAWDAGWRPGLEFSTRW